MPLFSKETKEEKRAKKKQKRKNFELELREYQLNKLFSMMTNEEVKEKIKNLDLELSSLYGATEHKDLEVVSMMENYLDFEIEDLLGFAICNSSAVGDTPVLVFTTLRIFIIKNANSGLDGSVAYTDSMSTIKYTETLSGIGYVNWYGELGTLEIGPLYYGAEIVKVLNEAREKLIVAVEAENAQIAAESDNAALLEKSAIDIDAEMKKLKQMLYSRVITDDEYEKLKAKLIEE